MNPISPLLPAKAVLPLTHPKDKLLDLKDLSIKSTQSRQAFCLQWMKHHNYTQVFHYLGDKDESDPIFWISDAPALIEQLAVLEKTLSNYPEFQRKQILEFARVIAKKSTEGRDLNEANNSRPAVLSALELIGKLTFLAEQQPTLIQEFSHKLHTDLLEKAYQTHQDALIKRIEELQNLFKTSQIQSAHAAEAVRLPQWIAEQLLTSHGHFNIGLAISWVNHLDERNFSRTIKQRLQQLIKSPSARNELMRLKKTNEPSVDLLIRASLNLNPHLPVTDHHVRLAALMAALSHIRQSQNLTCFSLVICLSELSKNLDKALKDLVELLNTGKLLRQIDNKVKDFSFLPLMNNKNLASSFSIDSNGCVNDTPMHIWDVPGIQSACKGMGIRQPISAIKKVLATEKSETTVQKIIMALAKSNSEKPHKTYRRGCFYFEAQTRNPLLAAWEHTIASMAEAKISGWLQSELLQSILWALDVDFKALPENQKFLKSKLEEEVIKRLTDRSYYFYDPFITNGGFVLYEKNLFAPKILWPRIDNAKSFQAFLSKALLESTNELLSKEIYREHRPMIQSLGQHLAMYVHSDAFLNRILPNFLEQRFSFEKPSEHLSQIKNAPWMVHEGNDTKTTLEIYHEEKGIKQVSLKASNAEELLLQLSEFAKEHPKLMSKGVLTPVRIEGLHAFSLTLDSFAAPYSFKSETSHYVLNKIILRRACSRLTRKLKLKDNSWAKNLTKDAPLFKLRAEIIEALKPGRNLAQLTTKVDSTLLRLLPLSERKKITHSALHIADSNWNQGKEDIHFCFIYSPFTRAIELWKCSDTNKLFQAMNQQTWVSNKTWDIFLT